MHNFWQKLNKPFSVLAPMEDVTDTVFRKILVDLGRPNVYFTEFVNVEGLMSEGRNAVIHRLKFDEEESPIVAQVWGLRSENFKNVATLVEEMGFDGIDINMGCPQRNVTKIGACAALIKNRKLAGEIIEATKSGCDIPVSVKTRIGFNSIVTEEWISFLLGFDLAALTIHLRTAKEMSGVPAHWNEMEKIIELRDKISPNTLIIGNGDIVDYPDIASKCRKYDMNGGMIGRGVFNNITAFNEKGPTELSEKERIDLCIKHIKLFDKTWGEKKKYDILKKYYKIYISGFEGAKELRMGLMETKSATEALKVLLRDNK